MGILSFILCWFWDARTGDFVSGSQNQLKITHANTSDEIRKRRGGAVAPCCGGAVALQSIDLFSFHYFHLFSLFYLFRVVNCITASSCERGRRPCGQIESTRPKSQIDTKGKFLLFLFLSFIPPPSTLPLPSKGGVNGGSCPLLFSFSSLPWPLSLSLSHS